MGAVSAQMTPGVRVNSGQKGQSVPTAFCPARPCRHWLNVQEPSTQICPHTTTTRGPQRLLASTWCAAKNALAMNKTDHITLKIWKCENGLLEVFLWNHMIFGTFSDWVIKTHVLILNFTKVVSYCLINFAVNPKFLPFFSSPFYFLFFPTLKCLSSTTSAEEMSGKKLIQNTVSFPNILNKSEIEWANDPIQLYNYHSCTLEIRSKFTSELPSSSPTSASYLMHLCTFARMEWIIALLDFYIVPHCLHEANCYMSRSKLQKRGVTSAFLVMALYESLLTKGAKRSLSLSK